jgi:hypothetical protein
MHRKRRVDGSQLPSSLLTVHAEADYLHDLR